MRSGGCARPVRGQGPGFQRGHVLTQVRATRCSRNGRSAVTLRPVGDIDVVEADNDLLNHTGRLDAPNPACAPASRSSVGSASRRAAAEASDGGADRQAMMHQRLDGDGRP